MAQLTLDYQCVVAFEALDPVTGAAVADVVITDAVIYGYDLSAGAAPPEPTDTSVPLLTPVDINEQTDPVDSET